MRYVLAHPCGDPFPAQGLPERAVLDSVRNLGVRFRDARLREVPILRAPELDGRADATGATRIWLALEALQVTGSFKVRGAFAAVAAKRERGHVVTAGAGNHGVAVAYAARVLGVPATVVVPRAAPVAQRERIARYGAEVVTAHGDQDAAEAMARTMAATLGAALISLYDDIEVVLGNGSSLGFEIVRALGGVPERTLVPIAGGALATGLAWALAAETVGETERGVWGVQSEASCAMARSLELGQAVEEPPLAVLEGLGNLSAASFARARAVVSGVVVMTEQQVAKAMVHAHRDMGLDLEGSGAIALAPVLAGLPEPLRGGDLVVVLTGRNVDREALESALAFDVD